MVAATLAAVNGRLYLVCDARPRDFLRRALEGGVDVIQLRDRGLDDDGLVRAAEDFRAAADEFGVPFILNDRPDLVEACGADGVHLGQDDGAFPETGIKGRSTHAPEQALAEREADYLSIGPVWETPTKPGRPAAGIDYVRWAAEHVTDRPWFAIGGIDASNVREVVEAGARRIVVVRAITEAEDPEAAARELRDGLA
jgi:thiamine-phosphate pyrophosphorylase